MRQPPAAHAPQPQYAQPVPGPAPQAAPGQVPAAVYGAPQVPVGAPQVRGAVANGRAAGEDEIPF